MPSNAFETPLAQAGALSMGVYEFTVTALMDVTILSDEAFTQEATFLVQFDVDRAGPCTSDLDEDGDIDLADYSLFQRDINGPPPSASRPPKED